MPRHALPRNETVAALGRSRRPGVGWDCGVHRTVTDEFTPASRAAGDAVAARTAGRTVRTAARWQVMTLRHASEHAVSVPTPRLAVGVGEAKLSDVRPLG